MSVSDEPAAAPPGAGVPKPSMTCLLRAVADASAALLRASDLGQGMRDALAILGKASGVDRVHVFRCDLDARAGFVIHEWSREGITPMMEIDAGPFPFEQFQEVYDVLFRGEPYHSPLHRKTGANAVLNAKTEVKTDLHVPLFLSGRLWGHLCFDDCTYERAWDAGEIELLTAAARACEAALLRDVLEGAKAESIAREREAAAEARAAEITKNHQAIESVIDALAEARGLDEIVPLVLCTAAQIFGVSQAGYFVVSRDSVVRLRYWVKDGVVLRPEKLLAPESSVDDPVVHRLAQGFKIEPSYLGGVLPAEHRRALVIDHFTGSSEPDFDRWAVGFGGHLELNVPCLVGGFCEAAITFYRGLDRPYSVSEIALAESLAKQLALAAQADRLSTQAREVAIGREREAAAQRRIEDLNELNRVLVRGAQRVAASGDPHAVLVAFLREAKAVAGAFCGAVYRRVEGTRHEPLVVSINGRVLTAAEIAESPVFARVEQWTQSDPGGLIASLGSGQPRYVPISECEPCMYPELVEYHRSVGNVAAWYLPLMLGEQYVGYLALGIQRSDPPTDEESQLLQALRQHLTLAFELQRLTERDRQATALAERSRLARDIHDNLAQGLIGILMSTREAQAAVGDETRREALRELLVRSEQLALENLSEARRSLSVLRPSSQVPLDLHKLMARFCKGVEKESGVSIACSSHCPPDIMPADVANELRRIAEEAVRNSVRHGAPKHVSVTIEHFGQHGVRVSVVDDGRGFDPEEPHPGHYGVVGMHERATRIGAVLTIVSEHGRGTQVIAAWTPAASASSKHAGWPQP